MNQMNALTRALSLALCSGLFLAACGKTASDAAARAPDRPAGPAARSAGKGAAAALLSKEEVGAVLGKPVTTVEGTGTHLTYKTDVLLLEAGIELDEHDDVAEAVEAMKGARTATGFLGGESQTIPGLGDEAFFGAMSFLYVRKGATFFTITPPRMQQIAQMKAYEKVRDAKLGSDEQRAAMKGLEQTSRNDPLTAGLAKPDAMGGAVAVIQASSKPQGTEYEAQERAIAQALATKLLAKL